jgi:hypothetical protein
MPAGVLVAARRRPDGFLSPCVPRAKTPSGRHAETFRPYEVEQPPVLRTVDRHRCARVDDARRLTKIPAPHPSGTVPTSRPQPLEPHQGSGNPWRCRCTSCEREVLPRYGNVKKGGCVWCARRRIDPDEAVATTLEHEHPGSDRRTAVLRGSQEARPYPAGRDDVAPSGLAGGRHLYGVSPLPFHGQTSLRFLGRC